MITVECFGGQENVKDVSELEASLQAKREQGFTEFWLSHADVRYPAISILVNGNVSVVHYFPEEGHPGFIPSEGTEQLERLGSTTFHIDSVQEKTEMPNTAVIAFSSSVAVAKEFFTSSELPEAIRWVEL